MNHKKRWNTEHTIEQNSDKWTIDDIEHHIFHERVAPSVLSGMTFDELLIFPLYQTNTIHHVYCMCHYHYEPSLLADEEKTERAHALFPQTFLILASYDSK
jgi:hypothetical protein